jgi:DNA-binding LacI/PurR family transcriptional regulator
MNPVRAQVNNQAVGRIVANHLTELGLKHFAYYGLPLALYSKERQKSFTDRLNWSGFSCDVYSDGKSQTDAARQRASGTASVAGILA